jgi:hypothetical protein
MQIKEPYDKINRQPNNLLSFDNIWKLSLLAFMIASLYLQNNFLSKSEFIATEDKVRKLEMLISQLELKSKIDEQQTKTLESIETRLRIIEQQTAILNTRINK